MDNSWPLKIPIKNDKSKSIYQQGWKVLRFSLRREADDASPCIRLKAMHSNQKTSYILARDDIGTSNLEFIFAKLIRMSEIIAGDCVS